MAPPSRRTFTQIVLCIVLACSSLQIHSEVLSEVTHEGLVEVSDTHMLRLHQVAYHKFRAHPSEGSSLSHLQVARSHVAGSKAEKARHASTVEAMNGADAVNTKQKSNSHSAKK